MADQIDNFLFISLVEQKPVLWDKTMDLYKNRVATQAAWKEIMLILKPDFETCDEKTRQTYAKLIIQRWTHIRDNYNRSRKKIQDQKRLGSAKTVKPYVYSKQLSFLQKLIPPDDTANNLTTEDSTKSDTQDHNFRINEESEIKPVETYSVTQNIIPKRTPKRPMKNDISPADAKIMKMDTNPHQEPNNRHLSFFNGILPTLNDFDDNEVLEFQMGVLQLLKSIKNSRQNHQSPNYVRQVADVNPGILCSIKEESSGDIYVDDI